MSLSRRCTMPGRRTPPIPARLGPQCASSALTSVPSGLPGAGCTTMPAGLSMTIRCASSKRMSSAIGCAAGSAASGSGSSTAIVGAGGWRAAPGRATPGRRSRRGRRGSAASGGCATVPAVAAATRGRAERRRPRPRSGPRPAIHPNRRVHSHPAVSTFHRPVDGPVHRWRAIVNCAAPAKAGVHPATVRSPAGWVPAFAGTAIGEVIGRLKRGRDNSRPLICRASG